jgi:hypothetical protein
MTAANMEALRREGRRRMGLPVEENVAKKQALPPQLERVRQDRLAEKDRVRDEIVKLLERLPEPASSEEVGAGVEHSYSPGTIKDLCNELATEGRISRRTETTDERTIRAGGPALSRGAYLYFVGPDRPRETRELVEGVVLASAAEALERRREARSRLVAEWADAVSRLMLRQPTHSWSLEQVARRADLEPVDAGEALDRLVELGVARVTSDGEWRLVAQEDAPPEAAPPADAERQALAREPVDRDSYEPRNRQDERDPVPAGATWSHVELPRRSERHEEMHATLEHVREQSRDMDARAEGRAPQPTERSVVVVESLSEIQAIILENERLRAENRQLRRTVKRLAKLAAALA